MSCFKCWWHHWPASHSPTGTPWSSGEKHQHKRFFLPTYWPQSAWRSFPWKPSSKAGGNSVLYNQEQDLWPGPNKTFQSQCAPLENSITGRWWNFVFVVISTKSVTSVLLLAMWPLLPRRNQRELQRLSLETHILSSVHGLRALAWKPSGTFLQKWAWWCRSWAWASVEVAWTCVIRRW